MIYSSLFEIICLIKVTVNHILKILWFGWTVLKKESNKISEWSLLKVTVKRIAPALVLGPVGTLEALSPTLRAHTLLWFERTQLPRLRTPGNSLPCWLHGFATRRLHQIWNTQHKYICSYACWCETVSSERMMLCCCTLTLAGKQNSCCRINHKAFSCWDSASQRLALRCLTGTVLMIMYTFVQCILNTFLTHINKYITTPEGMTDAVISSSKRRTVERSVVFISLLEKTAVITV